MNELSAAEQAKHPVHFYVVRLYADGSNIRSVADGEEFDVENLFHDIAMAERSALLVQRYADGFAFICAASCDCEGTP